MIQNLVAEIKTSKSGAKSIWIFLKLSVRTFGQRDLWYKQQSQRFFSKIIFCTWKQFDGGLADENPICSK